MAGRNFLFVPGPTNTPDRVLRAMHVAMEDHRSSDFPDARRPGARRTSRRSSRPRRARPSSFPASGTGAWEASLSNTLSPGRPGARGPLRHVQPPLDRHGPAAGPRGGRARHRVGRGRADRALPGGARGRQERTRSRRCSSPTTRPPPASPATSPAMRKALNDTKHPALLMVDGVSSIAQHRLPDGRVGRRLRRHRLAEGPHAAGRPRHRVR